MVKRTLDVVIAAAGLVAALPLLAVTALAIRLVSPGPVMYRATRVGRGGRTFTMYKFRTMHVNRNVTGGKVAASAITAKNDPRVFPVGALLRRTKLDELPQLWNVLRGEMSLVGPRPEDPRFVARNYTAADLATLDVRPGLTSPGSVWYYTSAEDEIASEDPERYYVERILPLKLALDLVYVRRVSWWYDVVLIGRTAWVFTALSLGYRRFADPPEMPTALRLLEQRVSTSGAA